MEKRKIKKETKKIIDLKWEAVRSAERGKKKEGDKSAEKEREREREREEEKKKQENKTKNKHPKITKQCRPIYWNLTKQLISCSHKQVFFFFFLCFIFSIFSFWVNDSRGFVMTTWFGHLVFFFF